MVCAADNDLFHAIEVIPLSRLALPMEAFERAGVTFGHGSDDLDDYNYAVLKTDDGQLFAIVHYRGQPRDATDVFMVRGLLETSLVSAFVQQLARELEIDPNYFWFRASLAEPAMTESEGRAFLPMNNGLPVVPVPVIHWANQR